MPLPLPLRYSGKLSLEFWRRIYGIKDKKKREAAYIMGCILQDIELRTLRYLNLNSTRRKQ